MPHEPNAFVQLTAEERQGLAERGDLRARIILLCAANQNQSDVARTLGVNSHTVAKWRSRFLARRLDGLRDAPRSGAPRKATRARIDRVVAITLASPTTTRALVRQVGLSQSTISRIWSAFGVQPRRDYAFRLSMDKDFIRGVRNLIGVYTNPPDRAFVLSFGRGRTGVSPQGDHHVNIPSQTGGLATPERGGAAERLGFALAVSQLRLPSIPGTCRS